MSSTPAVAAPVDRRTSLGASDAPAVIGVDPWRSPADVWAEKTGRLGPPFVPSAAMEAGSFLEPALLAWAAHRLGEPLVAQQLRIQHPAHPELTATLDAVTASGALVEAKTAGLVGGGGPHLDAWGDADSDAVPLQVLVQVQHQFAVALAQPEWLGPPPTVCYVPALLARRGLVLFRIEPHAALGAALVVAERRFWAEHVVADVPPPDVLPSLETLARISRNPERTVELPEAPVVAWLAAREQVAIASDLEEWTRRALLAALDDAEAGTCPLGTLTYRQTTRRAYQVAATSYRRLAWKLGAGRNEAPA